jgi:hypothetical protein
VEFSLQMPGNAALAAVLAGIALHRDPRTYGSKTVRLKADTTPSLTSI